MHYTFVSIAKTVGKLTTFVFVFFYFITVNGQNIDNLNAPVPPDPNVRIGKLDNGLTYYIRKNSKPEKRAELRLVVNVGSTMENDDQQGLAHFCEHMAFNGTKNFKKNELVDYLESVGIKFGADLNAYTSFDETVYMLQLPTDSEKIFDKGLLVLKDWAHNQLFDSLEIEKERGVVIEEWRLRKGADERMQRKYLPILYKNSRYAERLPIGKKELLESFKHQTLKQFYQDWYRPDLQAVIVVGDIDVAQVEEKIKKQFSAIPKRDNPKPLQVFPMPDHKETLIAIATDKEANYTAVNVYYKLPREKTKTLSDYRKNIANWCYSGMLNQRLEELQKQANPPFINAYSFYGNMVRTKDNYVSNAMVKEDGIEKGLETVLTENERVKQFGFTASELERQKKDIVRYIEQQYNERDKTESGNYVYGYISNFLENEPMSSTEFDYDFFRKYVPTITLDEVNSLAKKWLSNGRENTVVVITAPEKKEAVIPSDEKILSILKNVQMKKLTAYKDNAIDKPLLAKKPNGSKVIAEKQIKEIGVTEWTLANGVKVVLKPTDFKNDEIQFSASSFGGTSLYPEKDDISASYSDNIINQSGVGDFDNIQLQKVLTGKIANVGTYISEIGEGVYGNASPKDIETMFQLIYLRFTQPRKDSIAFLAFMDEQHGYLQNRNASPNAAFYDTIGVTMSQYHQRRRPMSEALLKEINLDKAFKIYNDRFADASDFTFFFVGNFTIDSIKPFVEKYLGGLPSINRRETWKDIGVKTPKGVIAKTVKKGIEPKSSVSIQFTGDFHWNRKNRRDMYSLTNLLNIKLRESLREEKGKTYGVGCYGSPSHYPKETYNISISFGCAPDNADSLVDAALKVIDSVKQHGAEEKDIVKIKESMRRQKETDLKENRYWLNLISSSYANNDNVLDVLDYDKYIDNLKSDDIKNAANQYFNMSNYAKFVLMPEK